MIVWCCDLICWYVTSALAAASVNKPRNSVCLKLTSSADYLRGNANVHFEVW